MLLKQLTYNNKLIGTNLSKEDIEKYTQEAGVRKLKEILFEIISEINLELLEEKSYELPIKITEDCITNKYLKDPNKSPFFEDSILVLIFD